MLRRWFGIVMGLLLPVLVANAAGSYFSRLDYKDKLAKLFITPYDSLPSKSDIMPGYILVRSKIEPAKKRIGSLQVVDLQDGKNDRLRIPFPTADVLASVNDVNLIDSLLHSALLLEYANGAYGVLARGLEGERHMFVLADTMLRSKAYRVVEFPDELLKRLPYRDFEKIRVKADGFSLWNETDLGEINFLNWEGPQSLSISFEQLLDDGFLFYTTHFEKDYRKLLRAYEDLLFDSTKIDEKYALDTLGVYAKISSLRKDSLERDQTRLRFSAFRKSIALYQKKTVVPVTGIDQLNAEICDYTDGAANDFISRALFYQPDLKWCDEITDEEVDLSISLCDSEEKLIEVTTKIRESKFNPSTRKVLVVKGAGTEFFHSTLLDVFDAILVAEPHYQLTWDMLAQALYGGFGYDGENINAYELAGRGYVNSASRKIRLGFSYPECTGFNVDTLQEVSEIVEKAIKDKATPGAQLIIARYGEIVMQKSFGYHTYSKKDRVRDSDLYDVASVTKMVATWPVFLDLYEKNKINLDDSLYTYLPDLDSTDKKDLTIRQLLLHQSGLRSFIPFYSNAIDREALNGKNLYSRKYSSTYSVKLDNWYYQNKNARYRSDVFQSVPDSLFDIRVCDHMYMNTHYLDSMKAIVYKSRLSPKKEYLYSDLGYYFLQMVMDKVMELPLDNYYLSYFNRRLGAANVVYKPLNTFDKSRIVPTEKDVSFRHELLQGYVHDQGAAMHGGVAANAGVFSNAGDLAKVSQMFLNRGEYGGLRFFKPQTIDYFTSQTDSLNRRGLGVDKPEPDPSKSSPASRYASPESYGHSGFTGTLVWIDPQYDLIYIFLSNRIHPNVYNNKLIRNNVRTDIQDVIYRSMFSY